MIGIKNGLGHGEWIFEFELDEVERIDGTRIILDELVVRGSREIGLKSISSVLILSGDEQAASSFCTSSTAGEELWLDSLSDIVTGVSLTTCFVTIGGGGLLISSESDEMTIGCFTRKVLFKSSVPRLKAERIMLYVPDEVAESALAEFPVFSLKIKEFC